MSNISLKAAILAAGVAVSGGASANCTAPSCGGTNPPATGGQTLTNTIGITNGGVNGTNTLNGNIRSDNANNNNISLSPNYSLISNPNATATSNSGVRIGDVGSTSSVRLGDVGSTSSATGGNLTLASGAVAGGTVRDSGNLTLGAGSLSPEQRQGQDQDQQQRQGQQQAQQQDNNQRNQQAITLNQNYQAPKAAIALGSQYASVVVNDCVYARNVALGLSIADEAAAQVTIPLGATMVKGCGELKAELMTINGANAPEATPAQILLGVKTAGRMAPNTVGAAYTEMTKPENAEQVGNELLLFTRAPREVLVQAPATTTAPADAKSATTVTLNFHGAAAPQTAAPANLPPCRGKWVWNQRANTLSCERN
jgi:hypothetical protein